MFQALQEKPSQRSHIDGSGNPTATWHPVGAPQRTAVQAMRTFIASMEPGLSQAPDSLIRRHWPSYRRNHGVKISNLSIPTQP